jgi:hypothetical protein
MVKLSRPKNKLLLMMILSLTCNLRFNQKKSLKQEKRLKEVALLLEKTELKESMNLKFKRQPRVMLLHSSGTSLHSFSEGLILLHLVLSILAGLSIPSTSTAKKSTWMMTIQVSMHT